MRSDFSNDITSIHMFTSNSAVEKDSFVLIARGALGSFGKMKRLHKALSHKSFSTTWDASIIVDGFLCLYHIVAI